MAFGNFGDRDTYTQRLQAVMNLLESGKANDWSLQQLGFTKNWLQQPTDQEETETSKSEEELLDEQLAAQQQQRILQQKRDAINYGNNAQVIRYDFSTPQYDIQNDIINQTKHTRPGLNLTGATPDWNKNYTNQLKQYINSSTKELNDYFNNFAVNYQSILSDKNNIPTLSRNLARLFATIPGKTPESSQQIYDWSKYLTRLPSGEFMINGTLDNNNGRFLLYNNRGISSTNLTNMDESTQKFLRDLINQNQGTSGYMREGGVIKAQNGLDFSTVTLNTTQPTNQPEQQEKAPKQKNSTSGITNGDRKASDMDVRDWAGILTPAILDLTSMLSANVPGWGTVASAGTGIASTLWTGIRDWEHAGMKSGLKTLGMGLAADTLGLIPGWGTSAKLGKIAKGLSKYAKYIGPALAAKGLGDAAGVFNKLMTQGGSSLTKDDLNTLVYGLVGLTSKGTAGVKRANRSNLERAAVQQYSVTTRSGKNVTLNAEQLAKLRAQHKVKKATPVVTSDALIEANDQIMNASKWPIFGSVSQNRLEKMLELRQASERNIMRNTIWKPVGKGKYEEIPAYMRDISYR